MHTVPRWALGVLIIASLLVIEQYYQSGLYPLRLPSRWLYYLLPLFGGYLLYKLFTLGCANTENFVLSYTIISPFANRVVH